MADSVSEHMRAAVRHLQEANLYDLADEVWQSVERLRDEVAELRAKVEDRDR